MVLILTTLVVVISAIEETLVHTSTRKKKKLRSREDWRRKRGKIRLLLTRSSLKTPRVTYLIQTRSLA